MAKQARKLTYPSRFLSLAVTVTLLRELIAKIFWLKARAGRLEVQRNDPASVANGPIHEIRRIIISGSHPEKLKAMPVAYP